MLLSDSDPKTPYNPFNRKRQEEFSYKTKNLEKFSELWKIAVSWWRMRTDIETVVDC